MTNPLDYRSVPTQRLPSPWGTYFIWLLLLVPVSLLLLRAGVGMWLSVGTRDVSRSVSPSDTTRSVAVGLMQWGLFGAVPDHNPEHANLVNSITARMRGINGLTESGGLHGDGTDWYEVKLSPDLAAELRAALPKSFVERVDWFPSDNKAPPWWPTQFPSDAQCYRKDQRYLIQPDTGTRAWFMRVRT